MYDDWFSNRSLSVGFFCSHSTETALLTVQNDIQLSVYKQRVTLLVLLDQSESPIDTDNHQVLLKRLESSFGISGSALGWFKSYLDGRS